jgi:hypothetical protein
MPKMTIAPKIAMVIVGRESAKRVNHMMRNPLLLISTLEARRLFQAQVGSTRLFAGAA